MRINNDVSTPIATLTGGTGGISAFNDLGSGTQFGSYVATSSDNDTFVSISLNAAAITALNAATSTLAFGGNIATLNGIATDDEFLFGSTRDAPLARLELTVIPEPSSLLLFGSGLFGTFVLGNRRFKRTK